MLAGTWCAWSPGTAFGLSGVLGGWQFAGPHLLDIGLVLLAVAGALTGAASRERGLDEQLHAAGVGRRATLGATVAAGAWVAVALALGFAAGTAAGGLVAIGHPGWLLLDRSRPGPRPRAHAAHASAASAWPPPSWARWPRSSAGWLVATISAAASSWSLGASRAPAGLGPARPPAAVIDVLVVQPVGMRCGRSRWPIGASPRPATAGRPAALPSPPRPVWDGSPCSSPWRFRRAPAASVGPRRWQRAGGGADRGRPSRGSPDRWVRPPVDGPSGPWSGAPPSWWWSPSWSGPPCPPGWPGRCRGGGNAPGARPSTRAGRRPRPSTTSWPAVRAGADVADRVAGVLYAVGAGR